MPNPDENMLPEEPQDPSIDLDQENPFASMMERYDDAAAVLGLSPDAYSLLRTPDREIKFALPIRYPDGEIRVHSGYRIRHNLSLGPCLGGLRLDPTLKREEISALAGWTTWKCAAMNIPFGGSAGGIDFDRRTNTAETTEAVVRRYTASLFDILGPERDILTPDRGCDEQIMAWCLDTYSMHKRHTENAVVVGKPLGLGGSHGREIALGHGAIVLMERQRAHYTQSGPAEIVVQGVGNAGAQVMRAAVSRGHKIIAAGDLNAALVNRNGIDVEALLAYRKQNGSLLGFDGGEQLPNKELLTLDCDVLIPAACSKQILSKNAHQIRAKLIVEAANGPTSKLADNILLERGIPVVPDLLGNAGGVLVAYFEWVQNRTGYQWPREQVLERLDRMLLNAFDRSTATARKYNIGLRLATCVLGVERVSYFDKIRGIYS
ncbi:MAG: Glu/Leu/Phe/Val dehydrogenase [Planctomycetes bacterium]|nr:Glu/Leu/Phe/Val dehydrogenase [Planctomycetota bacterium]